MKNFWRGKTVVVTAGPTREPLDPVRYITNASSGRMGYALAAAARKRGAKVILVSGPTALKVPAGTRAAPVTTAREMLAAALRWGVRADVLIGAAAVADWAPSNAARHKLKKGGRSALTLRLKPNPDILKTLAARRRGGRPRLVGFALETRDLAANARRKLKEKSLEMIVANPHTVLDKPSAEALLLHRSGASSRFPGGSKAALAGRILDFFAAHA
jgi:phosphopantothenoylcysteine decarboxylase / phosphopantothenate---cysteine ligase